jgi:hypothetical protein
MWILDNTLLYSQRVNEEIGGRWTESKCFYKIIKMKTQLTRTFKIQQRQG